MGESLRTAAPMTPEQRTELERRLEEFSNNPEEIAKLEAGFGGTGNSQYDDFVKRARDARWWYEIKDKRLINYAR